ncbi:MAG TPA: hypothetical protein VM243_15595 [Phycisphaerae bacterium]|nr:hypothetical protein [Phycisphaerae bacterium]
MPRLIRLTDIQQFNVAGRIPEAAITQDIVRNVRTLNERTQIEPWLRQILHDPNVTAHGPCELADILARVNIGGARKLAAFVIKGKSSPKVSSRLVTHQFQKLRDLQGVDVVILLVVGDVQDDASRDFVRAADDIGCDYLIIDGVDTARLLISSHYLCPADGLPYTNEMCPNGHRQVEQVELRYNVREDLRCELLRLQDLSFIGARRLSGTLLVDAHYSQDTIRALVGETVEKIRHDRFVRNELVRARWGDAPAQVVWVYVGNDLADVDNANWVCRACWVDSELDREFHPAWDATEDVAAGVRLVWNADYHAVKAMLSAATGSKADVIDHVESWLPRAVQLLRQRVLPTFSAYCSGECQEAQLVDVMRRSREEAEAIYETGSNGPLPPPECTEYEQRFQSILAYFHNLWLFYTNPVFLLREPANRKWLFEEARRGIDAELDRFGYEREKLGLR